MSVTETRIPSIEDSRSIVATRTVARYLHHLRSLTIIRQLIPLITASQRHRGANLALLEGDDYFSEHVGKLEHEIACRFTTLGMLNQELSSPVPESELERMQQEWHIIKDWSDGGVLENFNLHSHFIEQLMLLIRHVVEKTNCFLLTSVPRETDASGNNQLNMELYVGDTALVQFILHETPELMELIARLRGLATHACVIGSCDSVHHSRLDYLLKQLNQKKERLRSMSKSLQHYALREVPALIDLQIQDVRLVQLIQQVEEHILSKPGIEIDGHNIFSMATHIIDALTEVIRQGLDFIQSKIHRQLNGWHQEVC